MDYKIEKNKNKKIILPTAKILSNITIDGNLDNNSIKTTFIKKNHLETNNENNEFEEKLFQNSGEKNKLDDLRKDYEITNLKNLLSDFNALRQKNLEEDEILSLNGFKYEEEKIYKAVEQHYKCLCSNCQKLEKDDLKPYYSPEMLAKKQNLENLINNKKENFSKNVENPVMEKNRVQENLNLGFNDQKNKSEYTNDLKPIYSQKALINILRDHKCRNKNEYEWIVNSLVKKNDFLINLKSGQFNLSDSNIKNIEAMIENLTISKKIFFENNKSYGGN